MITRPDKINVSITDRNGWQIVIDGKDISHLVERFWISLDASDMLPELHIAIPFAVGVHFNAALPHLSVELDDLIGGLSSDDGAEEG